MGSWNDFNDAQSNTNLIPKGTLAKVRLTMRPKRSARPWAPRPQS